MSSPEQQDIVGVAEDELTDVEKNKLGDFDEGSFS